MTKHNKTDELNILLPQREVVIGNETLTVREYSINDTMQLYSDMDAFIVPLSELLGQRNALQYPETEALIAKHYDTIARLIARSIDKSVDYVKTLKAKDGQILIDVWWTVNSDFFINAAARKLFLKAAAEPSQSSQAGGESLQP